jgi:hypothetical protein
MAFPFAALVGLIVLWSDIKLDVNIGFAAPFEFVYIKGGTVLCHPFCSPKSIEIFDQAYDVWPVGSFPFSVMENIFAGSQPHFSGVVPCGDIILSPSLRGKGRKAI